VNNITFDHRFYNDVRYLIMDEEKSLNNIKTRLEDDVAEAIWKEHGKITQDWAKYADAHNLWYPTTVYKDNEPFVYIVNTDFFGLSAWFLKKNSNKMF
jgi:hypothetical protein